MVTKSSRIALDAHLDAQVVLVVDVPGRGVAHDFAVRGLGEHRAAVEGRRQRREAERGEEALADLDHVDSASIFFCSISVGQVVADVAGALGRDERIDVAPFLRPHVAEQVGADRAGRGLDGIAVFLVELGADIGVERHVERLHFLPQPLGLGRELLGRHVVVRAPHRAGVG